MQSLQEAVPNTPHQSPIVPDDIASNGDFSALDLRDRVAIMAVFYEIVEIEQVEKAWHRWRMQQLRGGQHTLWRVLAQDHELDQDAIYEIAAQIYGFEEATYNRLHALSLLRDLESTFTENQWQKMVELLVVPLAVGEDPRSGEARLVFATHDPTRPEVARLLKEFNLDSFELCYAPPSILTNLLTETFQPKVKPYTPLYEERAEDQPGWVEIVVVPPSDEKQEIELDKSSLVDWFESVLVATYRERATETHIFLNRNKELEIHLNRKGHMQLWRKEDTLHPEGLFAYVMDDIIKLDEFDPGTPMEVSFQRWIDKDLTRFHISIEPALDSDERDAATVVLRVLGHREASGAFSGMGPWKSH